MHLKPRRTSPSNDAAFGEFWSKSQPGFRFSSEEIGSPDFFAQVEMHRYSLEPHIPEIVQFESWTARDVLEAGCGVATDGLRFARAGARYTGLDLTSTALHLARRRFEFEDQNGSFVEGSVTDLPFEDRSFDLVYSHGVIHHVRETQRAVDEFHRVLRPGGTALVMVYHRGSLNYRFNIMVLRRALAGVLFVPGASHGIARLTGETPALLAAHQQLLRKHGLGYLTNRSLFLSKNTDGPENPLSKAFSRNEARALFRIFADVRLQTRFLNLRIYPGGQRLANARIAHRIERHVGWHLYIEATKGR